LTINYKNLQKVLIDIQDYKLAKLLIVTKNQSLKDINYLIDKGYNIFGENKVQEAKKKFQELDNLFKINLHLIGPLQTNKVKEALHLFNTIQSVDREKLVDEISKFINKKDEIKTKSFYIQINIGSEDQKSGIDKSEFKDFYHYALAKDLNIEGLMCIPPNDTNTNEYFREMNDIRKKINPTLKLSMGMSNDYQIALEHQSNLIRIGSLIFND
jgi:pyridoxal phosphate enzyme (YggS family)